MIIHREINIEKVKPQEVSVPTERTYYLGLYRYKNSPEWHSVGMKENKYEIINQLRMWSESMEIEETKVLSFKLPY
jgi:hypothetical protein